MFGRNGVRCVFAAFALLALSLALITPKVFLVTANEADDVVAAARDVAAKVVETVEGVVGGEGEEGDDEPAIPGATVQVLTDGDFERLTQVATGATTGDWFVEFYAPWCGHCRKLEPTWNALAEKLGGQTNVGKVDVTGNKALGKRFGIKGFPTLMFFSHGQMSKYAGPRKLENLVEYAKGGYTDAESVAVPGPPSLAGGVTSVLGSVAKDLEGMVTKGKMPTQMTVAVIAGSLLLLMVLFAVMMPSKPRPTTTRAKAD